MKYTIVIPHLKEVKEYTNFNDMIDAHNYIGYCVAKDPSSVRQSSSYRDEYVRIHRQYRGERYFIVPNGSLKGGAVNHTATWSSPSSQKDQHRHYIAFRSGRELAEWVLGWEFLSKNED